MSHILSDRNAELMTKNYNNLYINDDTFNKTLYTDLVMVKESLDYFPISTPQTHTMYFGLEKYVSQKLPVIDVQKAIENGCRIEIHGIYPLYFNETMRLLGYKILNDVEFYHIPYKKKLNFIRPKFYWGVNKIGKKVLLVAVTPGQDYIYHYAAIIRHFIYMYTGRYDNLITIHRYPLIENRISEWTRLSSFISRNDRVIIGYVDEIQKFIGDKLYSYLSCTHENEFYISTKYKLPHSNKVVNFLGVKFSFWGCISTKIIDTICQIGAEEVIYIAKLGCLTSPDDLYNKIFSPTNYITMRYNNVLKRICDVQNNFVKMFPQLNTNIHISVPTVLEEDLVLRKAAYELGATTIDNEISKIANTISIFNNENNTNIGFAPIHFATDYIRNEDDSHYTTHIGLHNNRDIINRQKKYKILENIANKVWCYLNTGAA